jgi:uncharacterized protein YggU (UPF0235/DUF167 family)
MDDGSLRVYVASPPEKGRANEELVTAVARHYGLRRSRISIVSGSTNRDKLVSLEE